jgi:membrane-bound lytic murein transglycosylase D
VDAYKKLMNHLQRIQTLITCFRFHPLAFSMMLVVSLLNGCSPHQPKDKDQAQSVPTDTPDVVAPVATEIAMPVIEKNLWQTIVEGYGLPTIDDEQVANHLRWYANNQAYLDRSLGQSRSQIYHVTQVIRAHNLPAELALLPVVESSYNPFAVSPSKAVGIWQFVPRTGRSFGLKQNHWYDGRRDLIASTDAAVAYLKYLHKMFNGDWLVAIAAYNAGEGTLQRAIKKNKRLGKPIDFWSLRLPRQTESYVPQLMALAKIIKNPQQYSLVLHEIPNQPFFTQVTVHNPIDLNEAAKIAEIDPALLRVLNAGYNRWVTNPNGPHQLLVPIEKAEEFSSVLDKLPKADPKKIANYVAEVAQEEKIYHTVKSGESLWTISRKYKTTVDKICALNNLSKKSKLQPKQKLLVASNNVIKRDGNKIIYQISYGDTIHRIASMFDVSKQDILSWNTVKDETYIHPGQELTIYVKAKN